MADFEDYRGLEVLDEEPAGEGGKVLNRNFRRIADFGGGLKIQDLGLLDDDAAVDFAAGGYVQLVAEDDLTLTLSDYAADVFAKFFVQVTQDATGGRAVTFGGNVQTLDAAPIVWSTAPHAMDVVELTWNGSLFLVTKLLVGLRDDPGPKLRASLDADGHDVSAINDLQVDGASAFAGSAAFGGQVSLNSTAAGLLLPRLTTTERDNLGTVGDGTLIYNTTTDKFQGRANGTWVDLH